MYKNNGIKRVSKYLPMVLTSIMTFAVSFSFTACSNNDSVDYSSSTEKSSQGELLEPIGLNYFDFISASDVQILNDDTTKLSISKKLADKLGITSFVDHPMGIWEDAQIRPYHVRATHEILQNGRYILDVVQAGIAEFAPEGKPLMLSTSFYKDTEPADARSATRGGIDHELYTDDDEVIHPIGVTLYHRPAVPSEYLTRGYEDYPTQHFTAEEVLGRNKTRGVISGNYCDIEKDETILRTEDDFDRDFKFGDDDDTISVHINVPVNFCLNYRFVLDVDRVKLVVPKLKKFEAGVHGVFAFSPEITIGFEKDVVIKDIKKKIVDFTAYSFEFFIGPVPFWIDVDPCIYLKFEADVNGRFYGGFKYEYENDFSAGATYDGSWDTYHSSDVAKNQITFLSPRATFDAGAELVIFFGVNFIVDKIAGPEIAIGPKVTANAKMTFAPFDKEEPLSFDASFKAGVDAELGMKLKVWKIEIADWATDFALVDEANLWSYSYPQDMETKKDDPVTKMLEEAIEAIKEAQNN